MQYEVPLWISMLKLNYVEISSGSYVRLALYIYISL